MKECMKIYFTSSALKTTNQMHHCSKLKILGFEQQRYLNSLFDKGNKENHCCKRMKTFLIDQESRKTNFL